MRKETWGAQYVLMQEIGRKVKETREKLGIPLEILAFQTNSRITIIRNIESGNWIVVNKVDRKSESREKNIFKSIGGKKIDGRMRTLIVIKALNILKKRKV